MNADISIIADYSVYISHCVKHFVHPVSQARIYFYLHFTFDQFGPSYGMPSLLLIEDIYINIFY